jgi:protein O-GlcNAc transferase
VTFGSFNNLAKVNGKVVALWAEVLCAVPRSRLLLKASGSGDPTAQHHLRSALAAAGVDPDRIEFAPYAASARTHLEAYRQVDVALDTFPYNGTTTTCEALWMGVPVVTLAGDRHAARVGASLLSAAGFPAGIAERPADYVTTARLLAEQRQLLAALRANLRADMARSPLCDAAGHARSLEEAYRAVWHIWCAEHAQLADPRQSCAMPDC